MLKHGNRLLSAAGAATAAGVIAAGSVTAASAASPGTARASTESFQIMQATIPGTATVIAHGAFTASGAASKKLDKIVFLHGTFKLRASPGTGPSRFDTKTCLGTEDKHGTYRIFGGTGAYKGISGHGRYHLNTLFVAARDAKGKCSHSKEPAGFQLVIQASGPVHT
jgi:hypothetical protein